MTNVKIQIATGNPGSALVTFIDNQLKFMPWLDCGVCAFDAIDAAPEDAFFISVLEGNSFKEIMAINNTFRKTQKKTIFLSFWNNNFIVGPTYFPGSSAGADSCFLMLSQGGRRLAAAGSGIPEINIPVLSNEDIQNHCEVFYAGLSELISEIKAIFFDDAHQKVRFIDNIVMFGLQSKLPIKPVSKYVYPLFDNQGESSANKGLLDFKVLLKKYINSKAQSKSAYFEGPAAASSPGDSYQRIAIVGGGTAGYLTALSLKKTDPHLEVTLIESSKVPVIGVGEATTPNIRTFLFEYLGFSPLDFYEKVKPTWKLGIKFFWGQPGSYYFNYPFGTPDVRSSYLFKGNINYSSLISVLMNTDSSFVVSTTNKKGVENYSSLSEDLQYALHLDNVSFINYLKVKAAEAGVIYVDDLIIDTEKKADINEIEALIAESGNRYVYDFYVDCTGFRSLLLEKALGSAFVSYNASLFTDTAVTGSITNAGKVRPYTLAESMNNGWCWDIPMRGENHRGYVFSSAFCSVDEAADEIRKKNPGISELKTVRFRSGRHSEICKGNVFAIGNSFAFVEPLESTGIHMILKEVEALTANLPHLKKSPALKKALNANMNAHWDYVKDFLSIHYKFNNKFDTQFWKACRADVDISSIKWLVDLYSEVGLLTSAGDNLKAMIKQEIKDDIFGLVGFDTLMLGQGVVPKQFDRSVRNRHIWEANLKTWNSIQVLTIPIAKDLTFLAQSFESKELHY